MNNEELDAVADKVDAYFATLIGELNNNECEYVLNEIITRFESLLERVSEAAKRD
jgi:hypothetical protein